MVEARMKIILELASVAMEGVINGESKPKANKEGVRISIEPPHNVASQLNTFIPVGTAIIIVAAVK